MASTNSDSVRWVVGESAGQDVSGGVAALPTPFFVSTATATPTSYAEGDGHDFYVTSAAKVFIWDGAAWIALN